MISIVGVFDYIRFYFHFSHLMFNNSIGYFFCGKTFEL